MPRSGNSETLITMTVLYGGIFLPSPADNYVDLSELYVVLSDLYVDLSDLYVVLSLIHLLENTSFKMCSWPVNVIQITTKLSDKTT